MYECVYNPAAETPLEQTEVNEGPPESRPYLLVAQGWATVPYLERVSIVNLEICNVVKYTFIA